MAFAIPCLLTEAYHRDVAARLLLDQIPEGVGGHHLMVFLLREPRHSGALQTENVL
jgi:hypothetical protein